MIGRGLGYTNPTLSAKYRQDNAIEPLSTVKIDYFLADDGNAIWPVAGSPNANAEITSRVAFYAGGVNRANPVDANAADFNDADIISKLQSGGLVMIRGCTTTNGQCTKGGTDGTYKHWLLATAVLKDAAGTVVGLIANDPETGQQVTIDMVPTSPTYRQVIRPVKFSDRNLANFVFTSKWYYSILFKNP